MQREGKLRNKILSPWADMEGRGGGGGGLVVGGAQAPPSSQHNIQLSMDTWMDSWL